jgi:peptidoglycan/xylan/chitin deacetylase (PgdA/CDA1 family)
MLMVIVAAVVGALVLAHTAPFPFLLEYIGAGRSVWHMPSSDGAPTVYLTYDDGPNPTATPALLDVLARERAVATFFVIPRHVTVETAPMLARAWREGHAIGLHSETRARMFDTPEQLTAHLEAEAARLASLTGRAPCRLFRPHAGWRSGAMYQGLDRADYALAGWSFGMWDWNWWRPPRAEALARRLAEKASDGDIVVMHDGHHENPRADRQATVETTARLIPLLQARGFRFGRLCAPAP